MPDYDVRVLVSRPLRNAPHHEVLRIARLATARLRRAGWDGSQYQAIIRTIAPRDVVAHMIDGVESGDHTKRWAMKRYRVETGGRR